MVVRAARLGLLLLAMSSIGHGAKEMSSVVNGPAKILSEMKVELSLNYNWPDLVMSAPKSIDLLGQIGILASQTEDFLLDRPSNGPYKYLINRSFQSGLVQVAESGWQAFRKAHKSMDEIALRTADMPHNLKQLLMLMANKNPDDIQTYGPIYLDSVKLGMAMCKARATETVKVFNDMNLVVTEIIQGATSTKLSANLNLTEMRIQNEVKQLEKVDLSNRKKQLAEDIKETRKGVKVWEAKYIKAMDNFPSGWTQLGMAYCESLVKIASFGLTAGANRAVREINKDLPKSNKPRPAFSTCLTPPKKFPANKPMTGLEQGKLRIVTQMDKLIVQAITDFKSGEKATDLNIDQNVYNPVLTMTDAYIDAISSAGVQKGTSGPFMEVLDQLKAVVSDAKKLVVANQGAGKYAEIKKRLEAVQKPAICLCTMATELLDEPALAQTQLPTNRAVSGGSSSVTQSHMKNAEMMLNKKEKRLKDLEEKYEQQQKQARIVDTELLKVMTAIKGLKSGIVTTEKMLVVLKKALALLGKFKKEWQKLTRFFDRVENAITAGLGPKVDLVTNFFDNTLASKKMITKALGNILFNEIMRVVAESLVIKRVARKYTDLSANHLMPMVELAGQLITVQDNPDETGRLERQLNTMVSDADSFLLDLLAKETTMFKSAIDRRKKELRTTLTPLIDRLDNNSKREIAASVETGMETAVAIREEAQEPDPVEQLVDGNFSAEKAMVDLQFEEDDLLDDGMDFDF